jgi:hypothetical protein
VAHRRLFVCLRVSIKPLRVTLGRVGSSSSVVQVQVWVGLKFNTVRVRAQTQANGQCDEHSTGVSESWTLCLAECHNPEDPNSEGVLCAYALCRQVRRYGLGVDVGAQHWTEWPRFTALRPRSHSISHPRFLASSRRMATPTTGDARTTVE